MKRLGPALLMALGGLLVPAAALACATCMSSAFGDRTYGWAYLSLLVMPFVLTAVVGAIIAWSAGVRPRRPAWLTTSLFLRTPGGARASGASRTSVKETT